MWQIRGYDHLLKQIDRRLREGRHSHAYMLIGPPQVGKGTLAVNMAQAVNCLSPTDAPCGECSQCVRIASGQHADVRTISVRRDGDGPSRKEIGIDDVRDIQRQASLKPYEGRQRVFIFDGAEDLSEEAANALLKTLEEPPPQVLLILVATTEGTLLPTIRSRCQRLEMKALPVEQVARELTVSHELAGEKADLLSRLSMGKLGWAISAITDPSTLEKRDEEMEKISRMSGASLEERFDYASGLASLHSKNREAAGEVLQLWLRWWRDLLLIKEGVGPYVTNVDLTSTLQTAADRLDTAEVVEFTRAILATIDALAHNANSRLALEVLMLGLPSKEPQREIR